MTREVWKDVLEAVGALAIVASLILVAYELRQNTLMTRAQITQSRAELAVTEQVAVYNSDYMPSLIVKVQSGQQLTDEEMLRYEAFVRGFLRNQDNAFWQYRRDLLEENTRDSIWGAVRAVVGGNGLSRKIWEDQRAMYTAEFADFVDRAISE
jgi:hypothetical protein